MAYTTMNFYGARTESTNTTAPSTTMNIGEKHFDSVNVWAVSGIKEVLSVRDKNGRDLSFFAQDQILANNSLTITFSHPMTGKVSYIQF